MRILLVNKFFYRKGGSETYLFALAEGLKAQGHEIAFFAMQHPKNEPSYWNKYFVSEKDYKKLQRLPILLRLNVSLKLSLRNSNRILFT